MAASNSSDGAGEVPAETEVTADTTKSKAKLPRRQVTLIAITVLLNILLWTSLLCFVTTIYQIATKPDDTTNIASEVLTMTSALATIAYIVLHTIFSLKQRIWRHQRRHPSIVKKTSYVAVRVAVSLCILWLLTCGWNMITVARQPMCLPAGPSLLSWEAGPTCHAGRAGIAFAMIALVASCTLFWMLSVVRRPFEAHLLKHGYRPIAIKQCPSPNASRKPSLSRSASFSEKVRGRRSAWSTPSSMSNADVDTIDLGSGSPPPSIFAPAPTRTIGLGIFATNSSQPPPLPPPFAVPSRTSSIELPPAIYQPSISSQHLPLPPRMSVLVAPSGFVPLSIPAQFSASAWRAVHPLAPSPLGAASLQHPSQLSHTGSAHNFTYRSRYSRSSISLTRPHRLSSMNPTYSEGWSSRSGSVGADEGRGSPGYGEGSSDYRANPNETYAILNGACMPGAKSHKRHSKGHVRHASAPDATAAALQQDGRMSMGWKPHVKGQIDTSVSRSPKLPRSFSANLLSRFSPNTSPDDEKVNLRKEFEKDLDMRLHSERFLPVRKIRSADPLRHSPSPPNAPATWKPSGAERSLKEGEVKAEVQAARLSKMMSYDQLKNKPLPKIAML